MAKYTNKKNGGFTLLVAIVTTALLLIVSFAVVNVALKQILISSSNLDSQYAFYATESGIECAQYWDLKDSASSPFDPYVTVSSISCNGQSITPTRTAVSANGYSTSTIQFDMPKSCTIVEITKKIGLATSTTLNSRGYNNCVAGSGRRLERGVTITY